MPCLSCGAGRATRAILQLQPAQAVQYNPLFVVAVVLAAIVAASAVWQFLTGMRVHVEVPPEQQAWIRSGVVLSMVLNWIYLIAMGM